MNGLPKLSVISKRGAFPLHMTPFESYMFADDHARAPMTFVVQFEFSGQMDRDVFQRSIDKALRRHPMLRSLILPAKSNRDCWVLADNYNSRVDWGELDDPIYVEGTGEFINLREEISFRSWCRHDDQKAFFTFVFHHSACDGIGAYQFLGDVLWFYGQQMGDDLEPLPELSEMELRKRLRSSLSPELTGIKDLGDRPSHPPAHPVAPRSQESVSHAVSNLYPNFVTKTYEKNEYRQLRLQAQERGQTVNDKLLISLFIALGSWNSEFASDDIGGEDFCVNMPLDLRDPSQPAFSAINLVTSAFIRRTVAETRDHEALEKSLREETSKVKHARFSSNLMRLLLSSPRDRDAAHSNYRGDQCFTTTVFSNTGDPTRRFLVQLPRVAGKVKCGNLLLEDINGVSPLRYFTRVAISIFTYRRRLRICMRTDPQYFTAEDSQAFLDRFVACLEQDSSSLPQLDTA